MAIPMYLLKYGTKISDDAAKVMFEQKIKKSAEFKAIAASNLKTFDSNEIEVLAAHKFEFLVEGDDSLIFVERVVFRNENTVYDYQRSIDEGVEREVTTAAKQDTEEAMTTLVVIEGKVVETNFGHVEESIFEKDYFADFPLQDDYVEGKTLDFITPQYNWGDGCYPTYKHCGKNCGDNGAYGGGTPKNPYDSCCRAHDRCWANFGTNNCSCDCTLISCAKKYKSYAPAALHGILLAYFPRKSDCYC